MSTPLSPSFTMRLFSDLDTESSGYHDDVAMETILTPPSNKADVCKQSKSPFLVDEDSGLGMEMDEVVGFQTISPLCTSFEEHNDLNGSYTEIPLQAERRVGGRKNSRAARKNLFFGKRSAESLVEDVSPSQKRIRSDQRTLLKFALTNSPQHSEETGRPDTIIRALDQFETNTGLVADGSRDYSLPTIPGKHSDLKTISCDTMADVLKRPDLMENTLIVDCRYPFEYEGGHIQGAVNLYTKESVHELLSLTNKPRVIVFHCEFSSERGPKMCRFLRNCDREMNKEAYPRLHYPEVYLLGGGYKEFFHSNESLCDPTGYTPMLHKDHTSELRHFRVKSKSWAGTNQRRYADKSKMSRSCLSLKY